MVEDESLMTPTGMNTEDMDGIAEANMEMEAEDNMDMGDMDGVVDTSALSEEEETFLLHHLQLFLLLLIMLMYLLHHPYLPYPYYLLLPFPC